MPIQPLKICFCAFLQPDFMKRWGQSGQNAVECEDRVWGKSYASGKGISGLEIKTVRQQAADRDW